MEWENLTKLLLEFEVDLSFHEDNSKVKEMAAQLSPITLPTFLDSTNNHGHYYLLSRPSSGFVHVLQLFPWTSGNLHGKENSL